MRPRLAGLLPATLAAALVPVAVGAGGPSQRAHALQQEEARLAAKSRAAVLSLYALDSQLSRARTELSSISGKAASVRRQRADVAARLHVARHDSATAQRRLADRLRALYEQGEVDPIAIVLGAGSLDEAMTGLDNLGQMVRSERQVLAEVQAARDRLVALKVRLGERQQRLDGLVVAAQATQRRLESARASRSAYVTRLAGRRRLAKAEIVRLEAQARAAVAKSKTLTAPTSEPVTRPEAQAPDPVTTVRDPAAADTTAAPDTVAPDDTTTATTTTTDTGEAPQPGDQTIVVTATGYSLPGHTATGLPVGWGIAAVDPSVIPLGTRMTVPGYGEAVAADIGSAVRGDTIDLWFPTRGQARQWGRRSVTVTLH